MGRIIGIDLGTTNSLVCFWDMGKVTMIPNSFGEFLTPNRFHRNDRFLEETADDPQELESLAAIHHYHERVMPYLTENALFKMEMERQLQRFDMYCKDTFQGVHYPVQIEVTQASLQENAYNFTVTMENRTSPPITTFST